MLKRLEHKPILVHGTMPDDIWDELNHKYKFILYESYIDRAKGKGIIWVAVKVDFIVGLKEVI